MRRQHEMPLILLAALAACTCSSDDSSTADGHTIADFRSDEAGADADIGTSPDLTPPPIRVVVTSNKVVADGDGSPYDHVRWGTDHIVVSSQWFRRFSADGDLVLEKALPMVDIPGGKAPLEVGRLAAGKKLIGAIIGDRKGEYRFTTIAPDGTIELPGQLMGTKRPGEFDLVPTSSGFVVLTCYSDLSGKKTEGKMQLADHDGKLLGSPVKVADHCQEYVKALPDGRISYFTIPFYGLQHGLMQPDPQNPELTLSVPLAAGMPRHEGGCNRVWHTTHEGATWVGYGNLDKKGHVLLYNVEKAGKGLLPKMQEFSTRSNDMRCIGDVATDGEHFLVVYGEEGYDPSFPVHALFKWRARVFDLDGTPVGPAQPLPIPHSIHNRVGGAMASQSQLIWTGDDGTGTKDFVLFYWEEQLQFALGPMRMVRLELQE